MRRSSLLCVALLAAGCYDLDALRQPDASHDDDADHPDAGTCVGTAPAFVADTLSGEEAGGLLSPMGAIDFPSVTYTGSDAPVVLLTVRSRGGATLASRCIVFAPRTTGFEYSCFHVGDTPEAPDDVHWLAIQPGVHCVRSEMGAARRIAAGVTSCASSPCAIDFGTSFGDAASVVVLVTPEPIDSPPPKSARVVGVSLGGATVELPRAVNVRVHWVALERTPPDDPTLVGDKRLFVGTMDDVSARPPSYTLPPFPFAPAPPDSIVLSVFETDPITHFTVRDVTDAAMESSKLSIEQLDEAGMPASVAATVAFLVVAPP